MRVLLATYGSRGDVEPLVGLAVELRKLGAQVRVCAPPDEDFVELLDRVGLPRIPIGQPMRTMVRPSSPEEASQRVTDLITGQFDAIIEAGAGCDALVATGLAHFAARTAAEKLGIHYVYATFCPAVLPSPNHAPLAMLPGESHSAATDIQQLWAQNAATFNALHGPSLNAHRAAIGLPRVESVRDFIFTDRPWLASDPTLAPCDLDIVRSGAWILPDDRPLPAELEKFLDAGEPPVFVSLGSMRTVAEDVAAVAIEAIRAQGRRVIVGAGWAGLDLIDDSNDCFVVGEVNQQALFQRVAAAMHHGGAGTTTTAARAGAPQVVVPQAGDQTYWAERVAELGIGAAHDGPAPTIESLSAALRTALSPQTRARATALASMIRSDGAATAAKLLAEEINFRKEKVHVTDGYENELRSEQSYVAGLYTRLDAERARVKGLYTAALRGDFDPQNGGTLVARDAEIRALFRETKRLDVADNGLCFGRLDSLSGEHSYIGRIGILDEENEYETLLLDWRAPAARAFYIATGANSEGMRRRRQFHTRDREVLDFTDEVFGRPGAGERGDAALLAAVNAPRGEGMRDIVATIQAEQDRIIRLDHAGVLVIEGGPGTGKTVVALHRVAYLLYTQRERMERHGVLVVGPNPAFLNHIGRVLPSLGESNVVFMTTGDLVPGMRVTADDTPEAARLKGSLKILDVLAAAVADRQRIPEAPIPITLGGVTLRIDAETAEWARDEARASGRPHNEARSVFTEIVTYVLTERAIARIGKGWLSRSDKAAWEQTRSGLLEELAKDEKFMAALDALWPKLTPQTLLAELYSSPQRLFAAGADKALFRAEGDAWTISDVPLLDELVDLLGRDKSADQAAARERKAATKYAEQVLENMIGRQDSMDDEDHLYATDMLYAEDLAERMLERDTRELSERAAADRDWTYRHVVVDEAQELSEMDWRVLMRRCPNKSFTVVGDLAQRRSVAGALSWDSMFEPYVPGRWTYRSLTVNYRTPAEIMEIAAALLAEFAPGVQPPESVRSCGVPPWSRRVTDDELASAIEQFVQEEAGREGTSVVIGPPGVPGTVPASATKGLEFDAVLVVDPDQILASGPRGAAELYVALTRATQRLGVLHQGQLPTALAGLSA